MSGGAISARSTPLMRQAVPAQRHNRHRDRHAIWSAPCPVHGDMSRAVIRRRSSHVSVGPDAGSLRFTFGSRMGIPVTRTGDGQARAERPGSLRGPAAMVGERSTQGRATGAASSRAPGSASPTRLSRSRRSAAGYDPSWGWYHPLSMAQTPTCVRLRKFRRTYAVLRPAQQLVPGRRIYWRGGGRLMKIGEWTRGAACAA
jgi:hypothetical protein